MSEALRTRLAGPDRTVSGQPARASAAAAPTHPLIRMQRLVGNRATHQLLVQRQQEAEDTPSVEQVALDRAREDQAFLDANLADELEASGRDRNDVVRINTAQAIREGALTIGVLSWHPSPPTRGGGHYFADQQINTVLQVTSTQVGGTLGIPGFPPNRLFIRVRPSANRAREPLAGNFRTIVHEAQHYFDRHHDLQAPAGVGGDVFDAWVHYQTEFNAYWADGRFADMPVAGRRGPLRWQGIRRFLTETQPYAGRFRRWRTNPWFRRQVNAYRQPAAFNRANSHRIDAFYVALRDGNRRSRMQAWRELNDEDKAEVASSERLMELVRSRMPRSVVAELEEPEPATEPAEPTAGSVPSAEPTEPAEPAADSTTPTTESVSR